MLHVLGIDAGSVAVSSVLLNEEKQIIKTFYRLHHGAIREAIIDILKDIDINKLGGIASTASTPDIIKGAVRFDNQLALITAVKKYHPGARTILNVGGENFGLITFNEQGEYESYKTNSTCAAGTGSFLDQQVSRLKLESIEKLSETAFSNKNIIPPIASRCAVFAKTDLIHCQQEGYSPPQVCDSLCEGLVKNIADTLFGNESIKKPVIFTGGVSRNKAVIKHLTNFLGSVPVAGEYSYLYGAIGAALIFLNEMPRKSGVSQDEQPKSGKNSPAACLNSAESFVIDNKTKLQYGYKPLELKLSSYPDFKGIENFNYISPGKRTGSVEVDIYEKLKAVNKVYMGIDIGSTSTKAVVINESNNILAGFYTMTAGEPLKAVQLIFEAINDICARKNISFQFKGTAATGAGRKFIGKIIGADQVIDEITSHARAAFKLDPEVDTIIEIGGQDSKFTTLKNGMVTFCVMNNVCAAGTGSFIEEQAQKLGCALSEYSDRAMNKVSPVSSDRCTVFMERDINHFLSDGYPVDEILASVLHSVRDNYFSKVAGEANIGKKIFFQGATAKNKALVAAFENKLDKPIYVSKYCHLTGAFGCALILAESNIKQSKFRGISLYKDEIPVESEVCNLCHNNCKIKKVTVQNEIVAFGFLCGRDYNSGKHADKKSGFDLVKEYKRVFKAFNKPGKYRSSITIGMPHGLYLSEENVLWTHFFNTLGIKTISSEWAKDTFKTGKKTAKAEFCAPITEFYGQVKYLSEKSDYVFLPVYFESREKEKDVFRHYCYYSQFAVSLVSSSQGIKLKNKSITPVIYPGDFMTKVELYRALRPAIGADYWSIASAYDAALEFYKESRSKIQNIYQREIAQGDDIKVMLLGRPYVVLDNNMNKGIPGIFGGLNTKVFYHDMLAYTKNDVREIEPLLRAFHWNYTARILAVSAVIAKTKGIYPVYISSFKCSPDSFAIEYFKRIMEDYEKPYIILDLDEHGSNVGYETRIEAAVRAFRNHFNQKKSPAVYKNYLSVNPETEVEITKKTLLFPSWDDLTVKLVEAVLKKEGIDARLVPVTEQAIKFGLKSNKGQCLPVSIIYQSFIDYIKENNLNPLDTAVWMLNSRLACNIRLYPYLVKSMFKSYGNGMEHISVYTGSLSLMDISLKAGVETYFAYMFGGMIRKMGCKIRPYERDKGSTDKVIGQSVNIFYDAFIGKKPLEKAVVEVVGNFKNIRIEKTNRPKIALFGDLYVRDNDIMNQYLVKFIEDVGGEVITVSLSDFAKMVTNSYVKRWLWDGRIKDAITSKGVMMMAGTIENIYYKHFNEILKEKETKKPIDLKFIMEKFHVMPEHAGESMDNLITIFSLLEQYPDISLFAQLSPAFCCAGLITEAMTPSIESVTGVPIVSLTYDGTGKKQNDKLIPYIKFPKKRTIRSMQA
ncbi:MAG: acyl-CoA dehydratase activase [bacterium]